MEHEKRPRFPSLYFLNVRHGVEDIETVWSHAREADIIFLEGVGSSDAGRQHLTRSVEKAANTGNRIFRFVRKLLFLSTIYKSDGFLMGMVSHAIDEKKEIYLIDSRESDPGYKEQKYANALLDRANLTFLRGDIETAYENYFEFTMAQADATVKRDATTLAQIEEMILGRPDWAGKRIAVIQGAEHTKVYRDFVKRNPHIDAKRKVMMMNGGTYSVNHEFRTRMSMGQNGEKLGMVFKRDFLGNYFLPQALRSYIPDPDARSHMADKLARKLPDSDVFWAFKCIAVLQKQSLLVPEEMRGEFVQGEVVRLGLIMAKKAGYHLTSLDTKLIGS